MKSYSVPWHILGSFSKFENLKFTLSRPVQSFKTSSRQLYSEKTNVMKVGGEVTLSELHTLVTPHLLNIPSAISPSILFADFLVQCQHIAKRIKHWPVKLAVSIHTMVILESQLIWLLFCCTIRNLVNCKRWAIVSIPFEI